MPTAWLLAQVSVSPTSAGMPGAQLITQLMSWLSQLTRNGVAPTPPSPSY